MSTRKPSPRFRAVRPSPEALEDRQLLSATVSGTDPAGDHWTLKLIGPGTLNVSVVSPTGPTPLLPTMANTPELIDTITVSGTSAILSRLIGTIDKKGANSDGRVFFQNLLETGGGSQQQVDQNTPIGRLKPVVVQNGIFAINMPNFWMGNTRGTVPPDDNRSSLVLPVGGVPNFAEVGRISIPDGTSTLQFGGVDTTFTPAGGRPLAGNGQNNRFNIDLSLPFMLGTSIIVNSVITDATPANSTAATPANQDTVFFNVSGRVNLFQANNIIGDSAVPGTQFLNAPPTSAAALLAGGTFLISSDVNEILTNDQTNNNQQTFIAQGPGVTGNIGNVRIGGTASQFTVLAHQAISSSNPVTAAGISNFSVGGQTDNVMVIAGGAMRNMFFGLGMDKVTVNADVINGVQMNRGAVNSTVTTVRGVNRFVSGGDVVGTNVSSGYQMNLSTAGAQVEAGLAPPTLVNRQRNSQGFFSPIAQNGGQIDARIAGDVVNSIFSASIEPNPTYAVTNNPGVISQPNSANFPFGSPQNIIYPRAIINAKVEGTINNSQIVSPTGSTVAGVLTVAPGMANQAFFAKTVHVAGGAVIPPNVPEPPYNGTVYHRGQRGVRSNHEV